VAIIAPYRRQVLNFQSRIDMWDESDSELLNVEVATVLTSSFMAAFESPGFTHNFLQVDAFQGQERDIVMMSLVRSNDRGLFEYFLFDASILHFQGHSFDRCNWFRR
jgi:superfamily I DNA and/or RNA helicase